MIVAEFPGPDVAHPARTEGPCCPCGSAETAVWRQKLTATGFVLSWVVLGLVEVALFVVGRAWDLAGVGEVNQDLAGAGALLLGALAGAGAALALQEARAVCPGCGRLRSLEEGVAPHLPKKGTDTRKACCS